MKTWYEELIERGLPSNISLELAWTIPYDVGLDLIWGTDIITYKVPKRGKPELN